MKDVSIHHQVVVKQKCLWQDMMTEGLHLLQVFARAIVKLKNVKINVASITAEQEDAVESVIR